MQNLASGGGTWKDYGVTAAQLDARVGVKIARAAPQLWAWVRGRVQPWFEQT
jgi:putative hydrolase of HD superfamily